MSQQNIVSEHAEIINTKGLHARAAAKIVKLVTGFNCDVTLQHKQNQSPGASLIKLLTLDAPKGSSIKIEATGPDANDCVDALCTLIRNKFDEE